MSRFYYNAVAGNKYEGYQVKYINDEGVEFNFTLTPTLENSNEGNTANLHREALCNAVPGKVMNHSVFTISSWFNFAENMNYFDPMSVNYLGRSKNSFPSQTNFTLAFPTSYNNFVACNHNIQSAVKQIIPTISPELGGTSEHISWNNPAEIQNNSIIDESVKREIFNYSFSTNIEEMEEQFNMRWEDITEDTNLSGISWSRYLISSDETLNHTTKISLAQGDRSNKHIVPSGFQHFYSSYNMNNPMFLNKCVPNNNTSIKYEDVFSHDSYGKYIPPKITTITKEVIVSQGLPQSLNFIDEVFLLSSSISSWDDIELIPVYNDNNMNEFYFTTFYYYNNYPSLSPSGIDIYLDYLGAIRLYKDFEKNKWILDFSSHSQMVNPYYNSSERIGHYECDLNANPWADDDDPNGILLSYVNPQGEKEETPSLRLRKFNNYEPDVSGVIIPYLFGDNRFSDENITNYFGERVGTYILPKAPLYRDDYIKGNTYIATDSGSYTILI